MEIPLADLQAQYRSIKEEIDKAVSGGIASGQFILGPEVKAFESEVAAYIGVKHAVGVASGTDALHLAMLALGIGPGDEVITTPFTFIATVDMMMHAGARPIFVDIDPKTCNIDSSLIEARITKKTRAILPVHLYGLPVEMDQILALAKKHHLLVIEDCAQALGAEYKGKKVGSMGEAGCLSFFPSKSLGAYGDGGMVVTDSPPIAEKVDMLRRHGAKVTYYYSMLGFNSRLDALQATLLRVKLRHLDDWNRLRREKASLYQKKLGNISGISLIGEPDGCLSSYNYYTIYLKDAGIDREKLREYLKSQGVATAVYYPLSLHLQVVCKPLGYKPGDLPHSERAQERVLSLPMYPELEDSQIDYVAGKIREFINK
jgi:dTDP-4-amino-4,6-dideoxygalactose transaminase